MTDRLLLSPRHRRILTSLLREHLPDVEVWAYGSRVNERGHEGSDLDLVLRGPRLKEIPFERLMDFEDSVRESTIPFLVEARDWARLPERFHREIEREYVVVVGGTVEGDIRRDAVTMQPPTAVSEADGGALFEDWCTMPFGEAFVVNPAVPIERGSPTPFVGMAAVDPARRAVRSARVREFRGSGSRFQHGDTLFARITPCLENGKIARYYANSGLGDVAHGSTEFIVVRGRPDVTDSEYAFYAARSSLVREYAISQMTGTSGRQRVPTDALAQLDVPLPSLPEQRAIARILGTLDDKIELNRRMNETLEAMARALFKSWFVDFDPVRAKMDGRDTGLPQDIADLFPDRLVESEMGEIPEGWELGSLTEWIEVNPTRSLRKGRAAPYLPMAHMPTRGHLPESFATRPFGSGMRFANGDTLVARITPCLENGKTAYVDFLNDAEIGWGSTEYIVLRPQPPLPIHFAYFLARSARFREFAIRNMSGTSGRQRVPPTALRGFLMVVPPSQVSARFGDVAESLIERASKAGHESRTLAAVRDTLLPKLMSGELRLARATQSMEAEA